MNLPRMPKREEDRRQAAGSAFATRLEALCTLPPDAPPGATPKITAADFTREARALLQALETAYRPEGWTRAELRRAFFEGALRGWRPETHVGEWQGAVHVVGFSCPIAELCQRDPRACQACQLLQATLVRQALPQEVERIQFVEALMEGGAECRAVFRFRDS